MNLHSLARALLGKNVPAQGKSAESLRPAPADVAAEQAPSEREIFGSPRLLAAWVNKYVLLPIPLDQDYDLLPDADARTNLEITVQQRERCLQEYSVLRMAGVSLFVKQAYSDEFWMAFSQHVVVHLKAHVTSTGLRVDEDGLREALEQYTLAGESAAVDKIETQYMTRIYDDNPNYIQMKLSGIGGLASCFILDTHEIFRSAYFQVTQGCTYGVYKKLPESIREAKRDA
jgi:hypothetical protein